MITFEKQENGVLFTFENSDKYLYGDGTILVPFNSLAVIQDESDMITLRKSASWDIFLSGRYDTDFNYGSKEDAVDALKEALFDETGISEEEVQQMIDAATSGIPSSQVIEQLRTDVNAVSGEVDTLQDDVASKADASALTAVNDALTAHTSNTSIHVTSADKSNWDAKQDALTAGENITISGNVISAENNIIELTQEEYDALVDKDPDALYIITDAQSINMNDYATKTEVDAALSGKADTSALTAVSGDVSTLSGEIDGIEGNISILSGDIDDLSRNKANESAVVALQGDVSALSGQVATKVETSDFNAYSAATDARIAEDEEVTAAALNDLAETVSGKQDTLISGENIKTINNISILGSGNITISGGSGGGDYQYYSEDTTNESATIEVGHQSLSVDGNGVYVNDDPVVTEGALREYVTAEDLDANYYTSSEVDAGFDSINDVIDTKEEVIASALTELNLRVTEDEEVTAAALNDLDERIGDPYQKVSGLTIETDEEEDFPFIRIEKEFEDGNSNYTYINDAALESTFENNADGSIYSSYVGQGSIGNSATDFPDDNVTSERNLTITTDGFEQTTYENYDDGESSYTRYSSENVFNYNYGLTMSQQWYDPENDETTNSSIEIVNSADEGTFIHFEDGVNGNMLDLNTTNFEWTDGSDVRQLNWGDIASLADIPTVDSALTSASTNAVENRAIYNKVTMEVGSDTIEYDSEPVTSSTSGSRYYKVEFNDPDQVVTFTVAGLPDTIKLDGNTGQLTYTSGGALPEGLVTDTRYQPEYGVGHEIAFSSDYNVISAVVTSGVDIIYVGHTGTSTEWVKDVVADLLDTVSGKADVSAITEINSAITSISGAVDTKQDALSAGTGISISNNVISTSGVVMSQTVTQLVKLTQAAYDNLVTKDANTLYIISD